MSYVSHKSVWFCSLSPYLQAFFCHTDKLFLFRRCLSDYEHTRRVSVISVINRGKVDIYYISLLQHIFFFGNAMTYHLVNACTHTLRKTFISQACRDASVRHTIIIAYLVNLKSTHSRMNVLGDLIQNTGIYNSALSDTFYLFRCLYQVS